MVTTISPSGHDNAVAICVQFCYLKLVRHFNKALKGKLYVGYIYYVQAVQHSEKRMLHMWVHYCNLRLHHLGVHSILRPAISNTTYILNINIPTFLRPPSI